MSSGDKFNLKEAMSIFFTESREMLENFEECLLNLEKDMEDKESIHALFRAAHTIKGSSGMFGFSEIEEFTHIVENILDDIRNEKLKLNQELINTLLESHDYIGRLLGLFEESEDASLSDDMLREKNSIVENLKKYALSETKEGEAEVEVFEEEPERHEDDVLVASPYWHISLRFEPNIFKNGLDPFSFILYLNEIGTIQQVITVFQDITSMDDIDPELCYLGFEIVFDGDTTKLSIENVFDFLIDDCDLRIVSPHSSISDYVALINDLPEKSMHLGEMLKEIGSLTEHELQHALRLQEELSRQEELEKGDETAIAGKKLIGEIMVEEKMVHKPVLDAALEKQREVKKSEEQRKKTIRVDAVKLDNLINLIGELVITGANVKQIAENEGNSELNESVSTMSRLIEDVRDGTMNIRMVQIGDTFRRYERVVRDLSRERGKKIELHISGGETELDKTLIEKMSDPLMHLIRNAVDHGLGTPEERIAEGKSETGSIYLNSYGETGSIVVEVVDDGSGLNREKIFNKAVERNLIDADQKISDHDLYKLIFAPGFSTADVVTNISGRGVGMDVVRKNIEALRGQIEVEREENIGTTMRIHLPLTLAIIDGFMVQVGGCYYILPLDMVVECNEISADDMLGKDGGNFMDLRNEVLPFMSLREFFKVEGERPKRSNIIVTEYSRKKAGLVVDRPIGEFQTVIKPMGKLFKNLKWASGATILGTGEVAIILDVPMLIQYVQNLESIQAEQVVQ